MKNNLRNFILSNLVSAGHQRIGLEIECLIYDQHHRRLPASHGPGYTGLDLIGDLRNIQDNHKYPYSHSLEPGGQLEWASSPYRSLYDVNTEFQSYLKKQAKQLAGKDLFTIDLSLDPVYEPEEIGLIDYRKYELMNAAFSQTGNQGMWMMRNTTSTQVNIDYSSAAEAEEMAFVADCIQPLASMLFSNTPFKHSRKTGTENCRYNIWLDTDPARCGSLLSHGINSPDGLIDKFCDLALKAPAIFVINEDDEHEYYEGSLGQWVNSNPEGVNEISRVNTVLHQIFTHVRFKQVLEIRGCDRPPFGHEMAPAAFWSGLLLDAKTRKKVFDTVSGWSRSERLELEETARFLDFNQIGPGNRKISDWIEYFSRCALSGLESRSGRPGRNETGFLRSFLEKFGKHGPAGVCLQSRFETASDLLKHYQSLRMDS